MVTKNVSPCEPVDSMKKTAHYYVSICQGILVAAVFTTCITIMVKASLRIKNAVKSHRRQLTRISSTLGNDTMRRTNAILYIAAAFVFMWIPFGIITLCSFSLSSTAYSLAFTIGYEIDHASFAALPIVYAFTDTNFRIFVSKVFRKPRPNRVSFEVQLVSV